MELNLYKSRSITSCLKASYNLITDGIKPLLKQSWWTVLTFAVLMAIATFLRLPNKTLHEWGQSNEWISFILQTIIYLLAILASIATGTVLWNWLNGKGFKKNTIVFFIFTIFVIVSSTIWMKLFAFLGVSVSSFFSSDSTNNITPTGILANDGILFCGVVSLQLFLLPSEYVLCKVMMKSDDEKNKYLKTYLTGLRHLGGFILLSILTDIISSITILIICIPAILLMLAQSIAQIGALLSDPLNLPGYFTCLILFLLTAAYFISTYIIYWACLAALYLYGSYETQDIEKKLIEQDETNKTALH